MLETFDPNTIEDERVRQVVIALMNLVEKQQRQIQEQAEEIQRLRDEVNRLKGEQGCTPDQGEQSQDGSFFRGATSREQATSKEQQTGSNQD